MLELYPITGLSNHIWGIPLGDFNIRNINMRVKFLLYQKYNKIRETG